MADRLIDSIEDLGGNAVGEAKPEVRPLPRKEVEAPVPTSIDINYPEPTLLSTVIRDVAKWSGQCFVMEPAINTKIQIFAPRKLTLPNAYELFLASLSVVNLRAVQVGSVVKIVPAGLPVSA